ncbi:hypothetical protein [Aeromonas salmonicida]|uniref:hypothetical protein n=1 Tax=Aeromonas salmonicida TaxID=645 RepID=UPI000B5EAF1A|nr:hypothetical protein [Aeromonas salmonicida]ARW83322.1 hypothetical protein O23A_p2581 [Aeromonas salmonicida]
MTADYNPATYEPGGGKFINTTPCNQFPESVGFWCSTTATVDTPQAVRFSLKVRRDIKPKSKDNRDWLHYISFPAAQDVSLVRDGGGTSYNFKFILTDVGTHIGNASYAQEPLLEEGDCLHSPVLVSGSFKYIFRKIKESKQLVGGRCYARGDKNSRQVYTESIYLGYKLSTPDPLKMENGTYRGTLLFSIGNNKDFDFGNGIYNDSMLTINFTVSVRHQIKIEFPPGSDKVELKPPGGWYGWNYQGKNRYPSMLKADIPFRAWFSTPVTVTLRCEFKNRMECFIRNIKDGHNVPLHVYWQGNVLISSIGRVISPGLLPVVAETRLLSFRVTEAQQLKEMMERPGGKYRGNVTIIFDAQATHSY